MFVAVALAPMVTVDLPPMTDLLHHLAVAHVLVHANDPVLRYGEQLEIALRPLPTIASYGVLASFDAFFGPWVAAKLYLACFVIGLFFSAAFYLRSAGSPRPVGLAVVVLPLVFSWPVYMGFLPFIATLPIYLILLGVHLRQQARSRRVALLIALQLLLFGFHVVGAAVGAFSVAVLSGIAWLRKRCTMSELVLDLLSCVPVTAATIAYLLKGGPKIVVPSSSGLERFKAMLGYTAGSLHDSVQALLLLGIASLAAAGLALAWRRRCRVEIAVLCGLLFALGLALPVSLGSLWPAGPRLMPYALLASVGLLATCRLAPLAAAVGLVLVPSAWLTWHRSVEINADYSHFREAARFLAPGSDFLPVFADLRAGSSSIQPFWSLPSALTIETGAIHPYLFATPHVTTGASPLKYRHRQGFAFLYEDHVDPARYRGASRDYESVVLWGDLPSVASILSEEFDTVLDDPPLRVLHRRSTRDPRPIEAGQGR